MSRVGRRSTIRVTVENPPHALQRYAEGAAYVLMPRLIAAQQLLEITERMRRGDTTAMAHLKQAHIEHGQARDEIVSYGWQRPVGEAE